ncbi:8033_t:CDS:2, partial [Gigaspora rosea]
IARHEHYLAMQLNAKPDMKILDVGCGVGGPAREISLFTGAHVTGINNNDYQITRAKKAAAKRGLEKKTDFVKGNFVAMPFEDNTFDAVYAIEATCHSPVLDEVYSQVFRVLKPGGLFAFYEWCTTDKYDPTNPEHRRIIRGVEYADGIPELFPTHVALQALKNVGFEIEFAQDLAINDDLIPWYYPLEGTFKDAQTLGDYLTVFRMTKIGKFCTRALVSGKLGIFTPMFLMVGRKPMFLPPVQHGATVLNRELFRRTVDVIGVRVPTNSVAKFLKVLNKDLFNQPKLKNVVNDPESSNTKIVLLNPKVESL